MDPMILASASPRRAELLRQVGIPFLAHPASYREPAIENLEMVQENALGKAREIAAAYPQRIVLGADTVVICAGRFLGKPRDPREAQQMLRELSGREHLVITAMALLWEGRMLTRREETRVWLRELETPEIAAYVASGEPLDKAGAYGIQGRAAVFVERLEGCYFNVVGLPLALLARLLKEWGISIW